MNTPADSLKSGRSRLGAIQLAYTALIVSAYNEVGFSFDLVVPHGLEMIVHIDTTMLRRGLTTTAWRPTVGWSVGRGTLTELWLPRNDCYCE